MKYVLLVLMMVALTGRLDAAPAVSNDVPYVMLKMTPEKYKGKLVAFNEVYQETMTGLPCYLDAATYKPSRWIVVHVGDRNLLVILRKKNETIAMLAGLNAGKMVRVSGRIRELKLDSRWVGVPTHYFEADSLKPVDDPAAPVAKGGR